MRRRRRQSQREGVEPNTRLGTSEKANMRDRVARLLARPIGILHCPVSFERFAEVYNQTQPQDLVAAVKLLESNPETHGNVDGLKANVVDMEIPEMGVALRMHINTPASNDSYHVVADSPLITITDTPDWCEIVSRLSEVEVAAMNEWIETCKQINASVDEASSTFYQVVQIVNTAGQLNRLVPECVLFMSPEKQAKLAEQAKASAMPEGYFDLDHAAVKRMNDFLTKCRLMPEQEWDLDAYREFSWATTES